MKPYTALRAELADALTGAFPDLHVHENYPPTITPPAAVVEYPDTITYHATGCLERVAPVVRLFTSRSRSGEVELLDYVAHDGAPKALETVDGVVVREARNFGAVNVGGADLYTVELVLESLT